MPIASAASGPPTPTRAAERSADVAAPARASASPLSQAGPPRGPSAPRAADSSPAAPKSSSTSPKPPKSPVNSPPAEPAACNDAAPDAEAPPSRAPRSKAAPPMCANGEPPGPCRWLRCNAMPRVGKNLPQMPHSSIVRAAGMGGPTPPNWASSSASDTFRHASAARLALTLLSSMPTVARRGRSPASSSGASRPSGGRRRKGTCARRASSAENEGDRARARDAGPRQSFTHLRRVPRRQASVAQVSNGINPNGQPGRRDVAGCRRYGAACRSWREPRAA